MARCEGLANSVEELARAVDTHGRFLFRAQRTPERNGYWLAVRVRHGDHDHTWRCSNARALLILVLPHLNRRFKDAYMIVNDFDDLWALPFEHASTPEVEARWNEALGEALRRK